MSPALRRPKTTEDDERPELASDDRLTDVAEGDRGFREYRLQWAADHEADQFGAIDFRLLVFLGNVAFAGREVMDRGAASLNGWGWGCGWGCGSAPGPLTSGSALNACRQCLEQKW